MEKDSRNANIEKLKDEISRLEEDLTEREASIPAHTVRPHQIMAIEELEEEIREKKEELKSLENDSGEK
ncbi:hypothetical protein ACFL20_08185 [Spirochaetota bacterium]